MTTEQAVDMAASLAGRGRRALLGIAGAPGAGKSVLAERIVTALGPNRARLVAMDGFHLAQRALAGLGRADRKGAPDTFDAAGYVVLLRRLRAADEPVVWAPEFRRDLEEPIAGAIAVPAEVPLVVTEGNYLLHWPQVRPLLDECWWVECPDGVRRTRLIARHEAYGKSPEHARAWVTRSDEANATLVAAGRDRANLIVSTC